MVSMPFSNLITQNGIRLSKFVGPPVTPYWRSSPMPAQFITMRSLRKSPSSRLALRKKSGSNLNFGLRLNGFSLYFSRNDNPLIPNATQLARPHQTLHDRVQLNRTSSSHRCGTDRCLARLQLSFEGGLGEVNLPRADVRHVQPSGSDFGNLALDPRSVPN